MSLPLSFAQIPLVKIGKNSKNSYFSDVKCTIRGCLHKIFIKLISLYLLTEEFLDTNFDLCKHPLQVFGIFTISLGKTALCKISQMFDENQWRNNLSKLTTLLPIFQEMHSALYVNQLHDKLI